MIWIGAVCIYLVVGLILTICWLVLEKYEYLDDIGFFIVLILVWPVWLVYAIVAYALHAIRVLSKDYRNNMRLKRLYDSQSRG